MVRACLLPYSGAKFEQPISGTKSSTAVLLRHSPQVLMFCGTAVLIILA